MVISARAQTQELIDMCGNKGKVFSPDQRIQGCSALIEGGRVFGMGESWTFANMCSAFNDKKESDRAIPYCDRAIEYDPSAGAYDSRGNAYFAKGDADRAIADYSQAIKLAPKETAGLASRARAYYTKGELDRAISDYNQAIQLDPGDSNTFMGRGVVSFYAGGLANAAADFQQASALDPQNAYAVLWIEIVARRSHSASQLAKSAALIDMVKWPAPIFRLYLGKMTQAALLAAADDPDASTKTERMCEVNFYSGEWSLQRGKKEDAARLLAAAATDCPRSFLERGAAGAEIKALRGQP